MNKIIVFLVLSPNKYISILERNSNGTYVLLANIYAHIQTFNLYHMCLMFKGYSSDIRLVDLGLVENREFLSEEVDNVFKLEIDNIISAINS